MDTITTKIVSISDLINRKALLKETYIVLVDSLRIHSDFHYWLVFYDVTGFVIRLFRKDGSIVRDISHMAGDTKVMVSIDWYNDNFPSNDSRKVQADIY